MNEVTYIDEKNYKDFLNLDVIAFSFAHGGAMGSGGECFGEMTIEMCDEVCPPLKDCRFGFVDVEQAPDGWEGVSLGFGNFLVLSEPIYNQIKAEMLHMPPPIRYRSWQAMVLGRLKSVIK